MGEGSGYGKEIWSTNSDIFKSLVSHVISNKIKKKVQYSNYDKYFGCKITLNLGNSLNGKMPFK